MRVFLLLFANNAIAENPQGGFTWFKVDLLQPSRADVFFSHQVQQWELLPWEVRFLAACVGTSNGTNNSLPTLAQWYHEYGETGTHEAVLRYAKAYTKANVNVNWVHGHG